MEESLQAAIQAIDSEVADNKDEVQQLIAAKCRALMVGYHRQWGLAFWETVSVEEVFHAPIVNPQTGAGSRTFTLAGKFDGIIQRDDEEPDALYFGRLWHTAQEAWWSCFLKGTNDGNCDDATEPIDSPPQTQLVAVD